MIKMLMIEDPLIYYCIMLAQDANVDAYTFNSVIGKGTYAKVCLVTRKRDGQLFAMKILKKKYIIEKNQEQHIMTEKQILAGINHPFLVKMVSCFQDPSKLYFVLEYCPGGELFQLLVAQDKLSQDNARFFAAQILLSLDELHRHKIIYRDLKPQNIIIDQSGYIKLTDFGLSKILGDEQKAQTICGTPQYLAPQVIKKEGHGIEVDWWCLGCLINQMVTGFPPFVHDNRMKLFELIVSSEPKYSQMTPNLKDLLKRLLTKDPSKRLGHKGGKQIMQHPWFEKMNFKALLQKKVKAPFIPKLGSATDTGNFNVEFTSCKLDSYEDSPQDKNLIDKFKDFEL